MQRVQTFWERQVIAEYASAAVTAEFAHWLLQFGAPPELIRQALNIAQDEITHAEVCYAVANATGIQAAITGDHARLRFSQPYTDPRKNCCAALLDFYCLGETAAVPLFAAMRKQTTQINAVHAYERIIQDEPRHSTFGWLTLAWADETWDETRSWLQELFPRALQRIATQYYCQTEFEPVLTSREREWGMLPRLEYAQIFHETIIGLYAKQLKYYDIDVPSIWQQQLSAIRAMH